MISFKNVSKNFRGKSVLRDLSFEVPANGTVSLLGLSGSGKTTALKLACGIHLPDGGEIIMQDTLLTPRNMYEIRKKIGYVIQDGGLFPHLTAYENLSLVGREAGYSKREISLRVDELAKMTKLTKEVLRRYPREISGGQKQRVGLMRALFLRPPIFLLDEPLGALDPITRRQMQIDLKELFAQSGAAVLLVTHDLFEAAYLSRHIILLQDGNIAQVGTLEDLTKNPANKFVELFVNSQIYLPKDIEP